VRFGFLIWINRRFQTPVSEMEQKIGSKVKNTHVKNYCQLPETSLGEEKNNMHYQRRNYPIYKTTGKTILSPIISTLISDLQTNILMEGNGIEDFLSLLISANPNMSFMATNFGPHIRLYGETYWDEQIATQRSNSPQ
jgi:hypothetical protein